MSPNVTHKLMPQGTTSCTKGGDLRHITHRVANLMSDMYAGVADKVGSKQFHVWVLALTLVLAAARLPAQCPAGSVQPPPGLVAWWPLDEGSGTTVSDRSGLGNIGIASAPIGPSGNPKTVPGFVGNGMNFYFGGRVSVPSSSSLNFGPPAASSNRSFTVDAWIKGHVSPIASNYKVSARLGYSVYVGNNNALSLDMGNGTQVVTWNGPPITPSVWTFVAVVVDRSSGTVTLYAGPSNSSSMSVSSPAAIPPNANAYSGLPLDIGRCPGNPNGCDTIIDEVEIFDRALTGAELKTIFTAGSAGKCMKKGMTWIHAISNAQAGTITVGCGTTGPGPCGPRYGDTPCAQLRPLLCIYKPTPSFPVPSGVTNTDQYNRWSGGVIATTSPVAGAMFAHISSTPGTDANSYCAAQFGSGWRVAEFHDGWAWNFQAYGGTVSAPSVPSTRFWVHINDQPDANCWATP